MNTELNLTANFLTQIPGPVFLGFYGSAIAVILLYCWWRIYQIDDTRSLEPPPIPTRPDAYEIACLRGGPNELARVMAFSLLERGYLELEGDDRIRRVPRPRFATGELTREETKMIEWCGDGRKSGELFGGSGPGAVTSELAERYQRRFEQDRLMLDTPTRNARRRIGAGGAIAIFLIGLVRLITALAVGRRNVGFLILFMIAGTVAAFFVGGVFSKLSSRGKRYLANLRTAFAELKSGVSVSNQPFAGQAGFATSPMLLGAGLFGLGVLAGSEYEPFRRMYSRGAGDSGSSSGCGSSDSGSSSGSGGDGGGGGCGGCGGGGCGS